MSLGVITPKEREKGDYLIVVTLFFCPN